MSLRGYIQAFAGGMACAAVLIWHAQPIVIPQTNLLTSPKAHLTPVYYRVFILGHPYYSPHHATPDDNTLGRFFLVDFEPPYTGARVTQYLMKREALDQSRTGSPLLYANISSAEPVADDEIVELVHGRGKAPVGNPDQALRLVLKGREGPEVPLAPIVHLKEATQSLVARSLAPVLEAPMKVTMSVLLSPALAFYAYVHLGGIGWY